MVSYLILLQTFVFLNKGNALLIRLFHDVKSTVGGLP